ncbi:Small-conductance mechanosensitive channel [Chitinophaga rupis]|uniref:Small-conductance mechanosensitive channel n=2 Tax=Chitinophaga rupis TaxID=573321 RepID=A0A1H8CNB0_9BACT|nr:Small-conductance mechanosensitive channel [Chitinophaga rupis]
MAYMQWTKLIYNKIQLWLETAIKMLPNLAVAIVVLALFVLLARLMKKLVYKLVYRLSDTPALSGLFSSVAYLLLCFVGLFIALDVLQLDKTVSSLLAGAGIIGLALGFAFQDLTANFISGIFITFRKPFEVGHQIETNGFTGNVENIQLRSTTLRTLDGLHVIIPNKEIFQKPIINHSLTPERRISLTFNVAIVNEQMSSVQSLLQNALKGLPHLAEHRPLQVLYSNIDGANVKVTVNCWVAYDDNNNNDNDNYNEAVHAVISRVTSVMKEHQLI